jgi:hypothetical protein
MNKNSELVKKKHSVVETYIPELHEIAYGLKYQTYRYFKDDVIDFSKLEPIPQLVNKVYGVDFDNMEVGVLCKRIFVQKLNHNDILECIVYNQFEDTTVKFTYLNESKYGESIYGVNIISDNTRLSHHYLLYHLKDRCHITHRTEGSYDNNTEVVFSGRIKNKLQLQTVLNQVI